MPALLPQQKSAAAAPNRPLWRLRQAHAPPRLPPSAARDPVQLAFASVLGFLPKKAQEGGRAYGVRSAAYSDERGGRFASGQDRIDVVECGEAHFITRFNHRSTHMRDRKSTRLNSSHVKI